MFLYLFVETSTGHFVKTLFIHRLKVLDVTELKEDSGSGLRQRKCPSTTYTIKMIVFLTGQIIYHYEKIYSESQLNGRNESAIMFSYIIFNALETRSQVILTENSSSRRWWQPSPY